MDYVDKFIDAASWQETLLLAIRALSNQQAKKILEYILSRDAKGIEQYFYQNHYFVMKFIAREGKWLNSKEFVEKQIDDFFDFSRNGLVTESEVLFRARCAEAAGKLGLKEKALELLLAVAEDNTVESWVRSNCALMVYEFGTKNKVAAHRLLTLAEDTTQDIEFRHYCARAAGKAGEKYKAVNLLVDLYLAHPHPDKGEKTIELYDSLWGLTDI